MAVYLGSEIFACVFLGDHGMFRSIQSGIRFCFKFLFRLFDGLGRTLESPREASNPKMLLQFRDNLRATLLQVAKHEDPSGTHAAEIRARIQELLDKPDWTTPTKGLRAHPQNSLFTWNDAYQAEKLLAHLRPLASLKFEITKQIFSLRKVDTQAQALFQESYDDILTRVQQETVSAEDKAELVSEMQNLLERVLNDVHWKYAQRYHNRKIMELYTYHISLVSVLISAVFLYVLYSLGSSNDPRLSFLGWPFSGLEIALLAGSLGACFSILTGNKISVNGTSIEETLLNTGPPYIALRLGVGSLSAIILYFAFESGVLTSDLLPNLEAIGFYNTNAPADPAVTLQKALEEIAKASSDAKLTAKFESLLSDVSAREDLATVLAREIAPSDNSSLGARNGTSNVWAFFVPNANLSKLLIWSFAAGFFEKLVPKALQGVTKETEKT
ncbi:hypothetical protein [Pseudophaeobacter sp.]